MKYLFSAIALFTAFHAHGQIYGTISGSSSTGGSVGINAPSPSGKLDINQVGGASGTNTALRLRAGNNGDFFGNNQLVLSYNGSVNYSHAIKTRHNSGASEMNAIDFYVWKPSDGSTGVGSQHVMSLNAGKVGIGEAYPRARLEIYSLLSTPGISETQWWSTSNPGYYMRLQTVWDATYGIFQRFVQTFSNTDYNTLSFYKGNVGIGTDVPTARLQVYTLLDGSANYVTQGWTTSNDNYELRLQHFHSVDGISQKIVQKFSGQDYEQMWFYKGNVGIGTTSKPTEKLVVGGNIHSREVRVTVDAGADFVFDQNYALPPLDEVEHFVRINKHLPGIDPASVMEDQGLELGKMDINLLQKIEELTLYLIEQKKVNDENKKEIAFLKAQLNDLKVKR
jgi:hypothetical protein